MRSLILASATRVLLPLLWLFSVFILLRGHNEPGGGFIGGLVAASGVALYALAFGPAAARRVLPADPRTLIAIGLVLALGSALISTLGGGTFMTGMWSSFAIPVIGKVGTPFLFDIGVYVVVVGIAVALVLTMAED
ncbi:MAG: Na+/H+ antiporter subunit B [Bacteroidetes bacterium]|jgi:multicomponent Na+:H+ antiporter subunit B|nr:Na+/H+ antiporter subunit B [Bacteroidota bacterium]